MNKLKFFLASFMILTALNVAWSQQIEGAWMGALDISGTKIHLIFHIDKTERGLSGKMDCPEQGARDIPVTSIRFDNGALTISLEKMGAAYNGTFDGSAFEGVFSQGIQKYPMTLTREQTDVSRISRPQEPVPPYPYYTEEVTFKNEPDNIILAGTLTLPSQTGSYPVVVLVTGSGPQNRDEEIVGHKPFLVLADYLTKKGIGVLRYDDRGIGKSGGSFANSTTADFARDAASAIQFLKTRHEINKSKIGIIGHSEGGLIATMVTADKKNSIAFMGLLASPGLPGDSILLSQIRSQSVEAGIDPERIHQFDISNRKAFEIVRTSKPDSVKSKLRTFFKVYFDTMPPEQKPAAPALEAYITQQVNYLGSRWFKYYITYDPLPELKKIKCPVLVMNGSKDVQVHAMENMGAIVRALGQGGNSRVTMTMQHGLNHLFQLCDTGSTTEYANISETFNEHALAVIGDWILETIK